MSGERVAPFIKAHMPFALVAATSPSAGPSDLRSGYLRVLRVADTRHSLCRSAIQPLSRANRAQAALQAKISNRIRLRFTDCRLVAARRQAQFARAWTASRLPGGDIFLD